jgi:hypothetical protein
VSVKDGTVDLKMNLLNMPMQKTIYPPCRHIEFAEQGYSCIGINDWIIILKIEQNKFKIQYIIYGSLLQ